MNKKETIEAVRRMEDGRRGELNYVRLDKLIELIEEEWPGDSGDVEGLIKWMREYMRRMGMEPIEADILETQIRYFAAREPKPARK